MAKGDIIKAYAEWHDPESCFAVFLAREGEGRVAEIAEEMNHHPDMDIRWRTVTFSLATHSVGGVTQLDVELAHRIDGVTASLDS